MGDPRREGGGILTRGGNERPSFFPLPASVLSNVRSKGRGGVVFPPDATKGAI